MKKHNCQEWYEEDLREMRKRYKKQLEQAVKKIDELEKIAEEQNKEIKIWTRGMWTIAMWGLAMLLLTLFIVNLT